MKRRLLTVALVATLVTLTGCGSKKTLTCTQTSSVNGFTNKNEIVFNFKNDRVEKAKKTSSVVAEGDFAQSIDYYKDSAQSSSDKYNKLSGFEAKVESDNNKIVLIVDMTPSKMSESDFDSNNMGENYDSMKAVLTEQGYTCK